jgi:hypothetical protein
MIKTTFVAGPGNVRLLRCTGKSCGPSQRRHITDVGKIEFYDHIVMQS